MTDDLKDAKYERLRIASKQVLQMFHSGHNPTFEQLHQLESAIEGIEAHKICGHSVMEECDCLEAKR